MTPQFVDFNADGHTDIVTATFDGSPHVSYGSEAGFLEPVRVMDAKGKRVMLAQFWNYETKRWDENGEQPKGHCTSAVAFDWDHDGDFDLLLGSYGDGNVYRQMNEGTSKKPEFTGVNVPVTVDGAAFGIVGGVTTPRLVDWDGDGLTDLLCGGFGDSYGKGPGGGVWLYRNTGKLGEPRFAKPLTLVAPSSKGADRPTRPDSGLYPDAVDYDGDGDLDLVVGGYSHWQPPRRELTAAEKARVEELEKTLKTGTQKMDAIYEKIQKEIGSASPDAQKAADKKYQESEELKSLNQSLRSARSELGSLKMGPERKPFVWLYLRSGTPGATKTALREF